VKVGDTKVLAPDNPFDQADQVKVGDTKVLAPDNPFDQADQVKVGDTKVLAPDNPFDQGEITRRVVIAVSGDYIQYRFEREDGYVGTNDCHWRAWGILSPPQPNPTITCTGVVDGVFDYEQGFVDPPVAEEDLPF
jgi:hypothetical protein